MRIVKKKIFSCLTLICIIVLSYFYANIDKNIYLYNKNVEAGQLWSTGILQEDEKLTQSFISKENTIDGVNIKVILNGNVDNVTLYCKLFDADSNQIAESSVLGRELENNKFYQLKIPTITETKGKQYSLVLTQMGSDTQNGISFYIDPTMEDNEELTFLDQECEGNLVARMICHRFDIETFVMVLGMVTFLVVFMKILFKMFK